MRRYSPITRLVTPAVALLAAACFEHAPVAPTLSTLPAGAPRPDVIVNTMAADSSSADFTVTPTGGLFVIGPHAVRFGNNSICDPATSSYGPGLWDAPCTPLTQPIQIHAAVQTANGHSWVNFTPAIRFVPTADTSQFVWLLMKSAAISNPANNPTLYPILWAPDTASPLVDEAATDPALRSYVWVAGGVSFRRVKHFSIYIISTGVSDPSLSVTASPVVF